MLPTKTGDVVARWIAISYLISFIILPILVIVKNKEIRHGFATFARWLIFFSGSGAGASRSFQICEGSENDDLPDGVPSVPEISQPSIVACVSTWV